MVMFQHYIYVCGFYRMFSINVRATVYSHGNIKTQSFHWRFGRLVQDHVNGDFVAVMAHRDMNRIITVGIESFAERVNCHWPFVCERIIDTPTEDGYPAADWEVATSLCPTELAHCRWSTGTPPLIPHRAFFSWCLHLKHKRAGVNYRIL